MNWDTFNPFNLALLGNTSGAGAPTDPPTLSAAPWDAELVDREVRYGGGATWVCIIA